MTRVYIRDDLAVLCMPKCAYTSLATLLPKIGFVAGRASSSARRIALWREPHDRAQSAFRTYHGPLAFSDWIEQLCQGRLHDWHTVSQFNLAEAFKATEIIRWDFVALAAIVGAPIPHLNPPGYHLSGSSLARSGRQGLGIGQGSGFSVSPVLGLPWPSPSENISSVYPITGVLA